MGALEVWLTLQQVCTRFEVYFLLNVLNGRVRFFRSETKNAFGSMLHYQGPSTPATVCRLHVTAGTAIIRAST